jgi:hypothetical protein
LVDGDDERLDVLVAPPLPGGEAAGFIQRPKPRVSYALVEILRGLAHHLRPPNILRGTGCSAFSLSRSRQSSSILFSIRCSSASAAAVDTLPFGAEAFPSLPADLHAHVLDIPSGAF